MAQEINREVAAQFYDMLELRLINIRSCPEAPTGRVQFLGFADFQLELLGTPFLRLNGNLIKLINGDLCFEPKSEAGKGTRTEVNFPVWAPTSAVSRSVLTELLRANPDSEQLMEPARAMQGKPNPYRTEGTR